MHKILKWIQFYSVMIILSNINDTCTCSFSDFTKFWSIFIILQNKEWKNVPAGYFLTCKGKVLWCFFVLLCKCKGIVSFNLSPVWVLERLHPTKQSLITLDLIVRSSWKEVLLFRMVISHWSTTLIKTPL